jgi:hypothetical protein
MTVPAGGPGSVACRPPCLASTVCPRLMLLLGDRAVARGSTKPTCRQAARSVVPVAGVRDAVASGVLSAARPRRQRPAQAPETGGLRVRARCVGRRWPRGGTRTHNLRMNRTSTRVRGHPRSYANVAFSCSRAICRPPTSADVCLRPRTVVAKLWPKRGMGDRNRMRSRNASKPLFSLEASPTELAVCVPFRVEARGNGRHPPQEPQRASTTISRDRPAA